MQLALLARHADRVRGAAALAVPDANGLLCIREDHITFAATFDGEELYFSIPRVRTFAELVWGMFTAVRQDAQKFRQFFEDAAVGPLPLADLRLADVEPVIALARYVRDVLSERVRADMLSAICTVYLNGPSARPTLLTQ